MALVLHDTLTKTKLPVAPADGVSLRFYCCGPTVYGPAHIGNFRTFLVQDLFRRVVELGGVETFHVRNVTDVDDKTIRVSQDEGRTLEEFTGFWKGRFHADAEVLRLLPPHVEPGAVDHIAEQITLIETLIEKGLAYASEDGSVYFKVDAYPDYGKLSGVRDRELKTGASGAASAVESDEYEKDNVADFALWKSRKAEDGENHWPSPWGDGRPGWHLECSAMGIKYLGESFDLHSGGIDLCFPHHENEIAQSEGATGKPFARHWFHVAHLMVDGQKMSKSLGNLYTVTDLEEKGYTADEIRYALLAGHYRQTLNFSFDTLHAARQNLVRLSELRRALEEAAGGHGCELDLTALAKQGAGPFQGAWEALESDLNVAGALGKVFTVAKELETAVSGDGLDQAKATAALAGLAFVSAAFGWRIPDPAPDGEGDAVPDEIQELAKRRWEAKGARDWAAADALRDELAAAGWEVKDGKDGYEVSRLG